MTDASRQIESTDDLQRELAKTRDAVLLLRDLASLLMTPMSSDAEALELFREWTRNILPRVMAVTEEFERYR